MLPPKLILAPTDFSEPSNNAVAVAADLALRFESELCVVHVVPMLPTLPSMAAVIKEGEYEQELHKQAEQRLAEEVERLSKQGVAARSAVGTANEAAGEILRIAEHNGADLIVIATHGMTGWHKLAFGSVTEKVVRLAECPVLVLRAKANTEGSDREDSRSATASV